MLTIDSEADLSATATALTASPQTPEEIHAHCVGMEFGRVLACCHELVRRKLACEVDGRFIEI